MKMEKKFIELHLEFEDSPRKIILAVDSIVSIEEIRDLSKPEHHYSLVGTTGCSYSIHETVDEIKALIEKGES